MFFRIFHKQYIYSLLLCDDVTMIIVNDYYYVNNNNKNVNANSMYMLNFEILCFIK